MHADQQLAYAFEQAHVRLKFAASGPNGSPVGKQALKLFRALYDVERNVVKTSTGKADRLTSSRVDERRREMKKAACISAVGFTLLLLAGAANAAYATLSSESRFFPTGSDDTETSKSLGTISSFVTTGGAEPFTGTGTVSASAGHASTPSVSARATFTGPPATTLLEVLATADLQYNFNLYGSTSSELIPVFFYGQANVEGASCGIYCQASFSVSSAIGVPVALTEVAGYQDTVPFQGQDLSIVTFKGTAGTTTSNTFEYEAMLEANHGYTILLDSDVLVYSSSSLTAGASIDPYIFIDPSFVESNPGAELQVEPDVGNVSPFTPVAAVPEPATCVLIGFGLIMVSAGRTWPTKRGPGIGV